MMHLNGDFWHWDHGLYNYNQYWHSQIGYLSNINFDDTIWKGAFIIVDIGSTEFKLWQLKECTNHDNGEGVAVYLSTAITLVPLTQCKTISWIFPRAKFKGGGEAPSNLPLKLTLYNTMHWLRACVSITSGVIVPSFTARGYLVSA